MRKTKAWASGTAQTSPTAAHNFRSGAGRIWSGNERKRCGRSICRTSTALLVGWGAPACGTRCAGVVASDEKRARNTLALPAFAEKAPGTVVVRRAHVVITSKQMFSPSRSQSSQSTSTWQPVACLQVLRHARPRVLEVHRQRGVQLDRVERRLSLIDLVKSSDHMWPTVEVTRKRGSASCGAGEGAVVLVDRHRRRDALRFVLDLEAPAPPPGRWRLLGHHEDVEAVAHAMECGSMAVRSEAAAARWRAVSGRAITQKISCFSRLKRFLVAVPKITASARFARPAAAHRGARRRAVDGQPSRRSSSARLTKTPLSRTKTPPPRHPPSTTGRPHEAR